MNKNRLALFELLRTFVAISISLIIVFLVILVVSSEPISAIKDLLLGPLTSLRRFGNVIESAVPLMFTGLSVTMLYRAGLFNLSMEGAFFIGCVAACASALTFELPAVINLIVAISLASVAGGITTSIPGILKVKCNANELVTSLMLNYICLYLGLFIITTYFYDPEMNSSYSYMFDESMFLPRILTGTRINIGLIIAIVTVFLLWVILYRTPFGYKLTLVGKNSVMANYSGINTGSVILLSQFIGGAIAGLGGAVELFGMYKRFQYSWLTGYGWDGVLIAIVARYNPKYIPLSAFFLAFLNTGADIMSRNTDIPSEIIKIIIAIVIVLISAQSLLKNYKQRIIVKEANELESIYDGGAANE